MPALDLPPRSSGLRMIIEGPQPATYRRGEVTQYRAHFQRPSETGSVFSCCVQVERRAKACHFTVYLEPEDRDQEWLLDAVVTAEHPGSKEALDLSDAEHHLACKINDLVRYLVTCVEREGSAPIDEPILWRQVPAA